MAAVGGMVQKEAHSSEADEAGQELSSQASGQLSQELPECEPNQALSQPQLRRELLREQQQQLQSDLEQQVRAELRHELRAEVEQQVRAEIMQEVKAEMEYEARKPSPPTIAGPEPARTDALGYPAALEQCDIKNLPATPADPHSLISVHERCPLLPAASTPASPDQSVCSEGSADCPIGPEQTLVHDAVAAVLGFAALRRCHPRTPCNSGDASPAARSPSSPSLMYNAAGDNLSVGFQRSLGPSPSSLLFASPQAARIFAPTLEDSCKDSPPSAEQAPVLTVAVGSPVTGLMEARSVGVTSTTRHRRRGHASVQRQLDSTSPPCEAGSRAARSASHRSYPVFGFEIVTDCEQQGARPLALAARLDLAASGAESPRAPAEQPLSLDPGICLVANKDGAQQAEQPQHGLDATHPNQIQFNPSPWPCPPTHHTVTFCPSPARPRQETPCPASPSPPTLSHPSGAQPSGTFPALQPNSQPLLASHSPSSVTLAPPIVTVVVQDTKGTTTPCASSSPKAVAPSSPHSPTCYSPPAPILSPAAASRASPALGKSSGVVAQARGGAGGRPEGKAEPLTRAGVLRAVEGAGSSGITGPKLMQRLGARPGGGDALALQGLLQSLVEAMDVYRCPAPGAPQSVLATGVVDVASPAVCFVAM
ncbi:hypothetical protein V8C86DRAFT_61746 [Haematococcus lacustris]